MAKNKKRQKTIGKSANEIFEKAEARRNAGRNSFEVSWQAALETMLLLMEKHLLKHPGQLLPMQISGQEEWEFYQDIQEKLDLPPDVCAVLITPSAFKDIPLPETAEFKGIGPTSWERNAYSIVISGCRDHTVVMQSSLPGIESVGIDVFEDGNHFAEYTYNTIEECLDDLTKVTWIHFNPKGKWTDEQITRYTENWFAKGMDTNLENAVIHDEYSYVHHPELLNLTPLESVFKVIAATIPKEYDSLEKAIEIANDVNQDFGLGDPIITKEGILQDNAPQCKSLLGRIEVEIDRHLDTLEYIKGGRLPFRSIKDRGFRRASDETAQKLYEVITGREFPKSANVS